MTSGLRVFTAGFLDYAGLFPPAKLELEPAIRTYARDRAGPDAWMLGRFICPTSQLSKLADLAGSLFRDHPPFRFSALLRSAADRSSFLANAQQDAADIIAFERRFHGLVAVEAAESRLPTDVLDAGGGAVASFIAETRAAFAETQCAPPADAYEFAWSNDWQRSVEAVSAGIARFNTHRQSGEPSATVKMRCGGIEASAFPSVDQIAYALRACHHAGVPLKLTAGLHHPIRHMNAGVQTHMHGFLNVIGAAILLHARKLPENRIAEMIADESADAFRFDGAGFSWRELRATNVEISRARTAALLGFGSCSFDEPRDDLCALGLFAPA